MRLMDELSIQSLDDVNIASDFERQSQSGRSIQKRQTPERQIQFDRIDRYERYRQRQNQQRQNELYRQQRNILDQIRHLRTTMQNPVIVTQVDPWIERERNHRCKIIAVIVTVLAVIGLTTGLVISLTNNTHNCGSPPNIPYSTHQTSGNMPGAETSYYCLRGYYPVGETKIVCNTNGKWSSGNLSCFKDCSKPPVVSDSTVSRSGIYSFYKCHWGFYPVGESTIVCHDGIWSAVKLNCFKYCGSPPNIRYSTHQISGYMAGEVTSYHCLSGYVPVGESKIVCSAKGQWSYSNFACLKDCFNPPDVLRSTYHRYVDRIGVHASYRCKYGYKLYGESTITCQNGVWSTVKFSCSNGPNYSGNANIIDTRSWMFFLVLGRMIYLLI